MRKSAQSRNVITTATDVNLNVDEATTSRSSRTTRSQDAGNLAQTNTGVSTIRTDSRQIMTTDELNSPSNIRTVNTRTRTEDNNMEYDISPESNRGLNTHLSREQEQIERDRAQLNEDIRMAREFQDNLRAVSYTHLTLPTNREV